MTRVAVVGGGITGLSAARLLALPASRSLCSKLATDGAASLPRLRSTAYGWTVVQSRSWRVVRRVFG